MNRNFIFYMLTIAICGSILWLVFNQGTKLDSEQRSQTVNRVLKRVWAMRLRRRDQAIIRWKPPLTRAPWPSS